MRERQDWQDIIEQAREARRPFMAAWAAAGIPNELSLDQLFRNGAKRWPHTVLEFWSKQRPARATLKEADELADRVAMSFLALGLRPGDVVVAQLPHWLEGLAVYMAAMRVGIAITPLVHIYGPAEIAFVLRKTRARAFIAPTTWRNIDYVDRISKLGDQPDLEHVILVGDGAAPSSALEWGAFLAKGKPGTSDPVASADTISTILFTSGTTAAPKGALHTHRGLAAEASIVDPWWSDGAPQSALCAFPAGHMAGLLYMYRPFTSGDTQVYMDQFDTGAAVELIQKHGLAYTSGTPFHLNAMLQSAGKAGLPTLRFVITGAATVPPSVVQQWDAMGIKVARSYGSTEHPTISSGRPTDDALHRATTDGQLMTGTSIRLVDDEGQEVRPGEPGEILTMGAELMQGYLEESENAEAFTKDGYFRTGDIGVLDEQGFLTIVDRKKDIVVRAGEKISSKEVEDILCRHPAVLEAAVVGMPDPMYGERVAAFVSLREGQEFDVALAEAHFRTSGVARQKTPEQIMLVSEFPRTASGKIKKVELRQSLRAKAE